MVSALHALLVGSYQVVGVNYHNPDEQATLQMLYHGCYNADVMNTVPAT